MFAESLGPVTISTFFVALKHICSLSAFHSVSVFTVAT